MRLWDPVSLPNYHKNHLIWVDSILVVPLRLSLLWVSLATAHGVQPPSLAIMRIIWSEWPQAWWPPLSCTQLSLPAWLIWEKSDLSGLGPDSPPRPSCSFPLEFPWAIFLGQSLLIVYCTLFAFCLFNDFICCYIVSLILLLSKHSHFSIADPGNVFQVL
jgi:hypothetical protein